MIEEVDDTSKSLWKFVVWNTGGLLEKGRKSRQKINKIRNDVSEFDFVLLTETHGGGEGVEEVVKEVWRDEYRIEHTIPKDRRGNGVMILIKKKIEREIEEIKIERDDEEGRWICLSIRGGITSRWIHIWVIYAPCKDKERMVWMNGMTLKIRNKNGLRMIAGDFNFVMNTKIDKIGGNMNKGTRGKGIQEGWEREFMVEDVWRRRNPDQIETTWTSRGDVQSKNEKGKVKTE
jgi:exonuclease III